MWEPLWSNFVEYLPRLVSSLVVLIVFWLLGSAVERLARQLTRGRGLDPDLTRLLGRWGKIALLLVGAITALGTLGIDVTALVAGLGLTGFALGFALKDIISNGLAGILVIIYKPFQNGDQIAVTALEGTVTEVNLRYTVLTTGGKKVFIPNASLFTNPITVTSLQEPQKVGGENQ